MYHTSSIVCKVLITLLLYNVYSCTAVDDESLDSSSQEQFKCPEQFGYFDDPFDCSKYFVCVFGEALHEQCTGGLYFSADHQTCDWPRNIGCKRAPVVTVTTSTSTSSDENRHLLDNRLNGNGHSKSNLTKSSHVHDNSDRNSRDISRDTLDSTHLSNGKDNYNNSQVNLSPVQVINYDSLNDSVLLDAAAATVDRRVGSHFQNQRLNQISHQYNLQRTPIAAVQSPSYSHYDIVDAANHSHLNKSPATDFIYFDEDRDSESPVSGKSNRFTVTVSSSEKEKNRYNHLSGNNDHVNDQSDKLSSHRSAILNSGNHLTNLPLPAFKSSALSTPSSTSSSSSSPLSASSSSSPRSPSSNSQHRRPFVPPYSGFESTRNSPIRATKRIVIAPLNSDRSSSLNNKQPIIGILGDTSKSTSINGQSNNQTAVNHKASVVVNHHDTLPRRRPPKRLELPSLPPPPPPPPPPSSNQHLPPFNLHSSLSPSSSPSSSSSVSSTAAPRDEESDIDTHPPTYSVDTTTQSTSTKSNPFVLLDRDEESNGGHARVHAQSAPLFESYHHSNSHDKYSLHDTEDHSDDAIPYKSTRSSFSFTPGAPSTTTVTTTTSTSTTSTTTTSAPPLTPVPARHSGNPDLGQPFGLFDYELPATDPPVGVTESNSAPRLKKLLKPRRKPPPPSPYISSFDEVSQPSSPSSSSGDSESSPSLPNESPKSPEITPESPLFNPLPSSQPIVPIPFSNAEKCDAISCHLPDCNCGSPKIPGGLKAKDVPQIVLLTFDDAINDLNWEIYEEIFNSDRKNPNGCPILGTFYVSHEWTDYSQVQTLYSRGHEMASHGVSHSFGEKFTKNQWLKEVNGQRQILNLYGGVESSDVRGMRAPFLQVGGNKQFEMLYEANFTYDSSMPVFENNPPFYPYTLDFALNHECMIAPCPTKSYPGLWEIGMTMWEDLRGGRCSMADACQNPSDSESIYKFLMKNFNRHYKSNRAPFGLFYHSAWFNTDHHRKGFIQFIDTILGKSDVYFVTNWQMIQWMKEPTSLNTIESFKPWRCDKPPPINECLNPHVCTVKHSEGSRFMKTCQSCPSHYPWVGRV